MTWDGDFRRVFSPYISAVDKGLSYRKTIELHHEGVNLDKWDDLVLLKEVLILMAGSLCFSLKEF